MSIRTTKDFLAAHGELREHVEDFLVAAHALRSLEPHQRIEVVERTIVFLVDMLLPHALVHERLLYPEARRLIGGADEAAGVARDRAEVRGRIRELVEADPRDVGGLQELLYSLYVLLSCYLQREEDVYLRLASSRHQTSVRRLLDEVGRERFEQSGRRFARRIRPPALSRRAPLTHD